MTGIQDAPLDEPCPYCGMTSQVAAEAEIARLLADRDKWHEDAEMRNLRAEAAEAEVARLERENTVLKAQLTRSDEDSIAEVARLRSERDCAEERATDYELQVARLKDGLRRCPICRHEWRRHDPEDGRCDAGSDELGGCPCGRDPAYHRVRNATLSMAALLTDDGAARATVEDHDLEREPNDGFGGAA